MAQLQQFSVTRLSNANLSVPRWQVEGVVLDDNGAQVADFTGANAVIFPTVLGNLSAARQDAWVQRVISDLILRRFNIITD